ncbi:MULTISPECIES: acetyl-CoA carboxylase [Shinella]|uniref:Biotin carboxyl carrier protein of acetyl-CoA carboxylase n=2 Tax=Shinella TaxID=323620 RepID=A0AA50CSE3_9HYPH|nr:MULTISPECIES: acetyl-CoA carboxylase [Shinella]MDP9587622.1 biotin carboxyl carrier protein [Shinella zoogloeoides]MCD1265869.1 biotin carboxyl carrier domain-containing protein [Shinella sumterensis]TFE94478.1 acetyl-CoA carboxylase biotin carboxyl carrier protein subunit [Shinella sumterensis]UPA26589.1 biotin carboxyl carrier domain-containing protein [Shinella oryzae]WLR99804.1 acetyl-CoA carboxylase [Shinella sumterensis]
MSKIEIRSPLPGTFYRASSPDVPPFKADGDSVAASDAIGLIEVMKTFQEVPAGVDGKNITFLVENEEPVMAGQVIAEVEA